MAASSDLPREHGPSRSGSEGRRGSAGKRIRLASTVALGASLARRGPLAFVAMTVTGLTVVAFVGLAVALARREDAPVHDVPILASGALAWGGGFLQAVVVAMRALERDRDEGVRALFFTRTTSLDRYLTGRVGGLAAILVLTVGGGTLVVSTVALLLSLNGGVTLRTAQATLGALAHALAFAAVIAPIAFAALGARPRFSGYLVLLAILVVPELVVGLASRALPSEVTELCGIPSALDALRASIGLGRVDPFRFARALVALAVITAVASAFARRAAELVGRERSPS